MASKEDVIIIVVIIIIIIIIIFIIVVIVKIIWFMNLDNGAECPDSTTESSVCPRL